MHERKNGGLNDGVNDWCWCFCWCCGWCRRWRSCVTYRLLRYVFQESKTPATGPNPAVVYRCFVVAVGNICRDEVGTGSFLLVIPKSWKACLRGAANWTATACELCGASSSRLAAYSHGNPAAVCAWSPFLASPILSSIAPAEANAAQMENSPTRKPLNRTLTDAELTHMVP